MAIGPVQYTPEVNPSGNAPDLYQRVSREPANAGPGIGGGLYALGQGTMVSADFFGKAAADDAALQYQEGVNKILYGDSSVSGPDGKPDTGYMGLQGRAALDARPDVEKRIAKLRSQLGGPLMTMKSSMAFDDYTRRYKAITDAQVGAHADRQAKVWATKVNTETARQAMDEISANWDNPERMQIAAQRLLGARIKQAELDGGGPELIEAATRNAFKDGLSAQLRAMAVHNPARAIEVLEKNRHVAGTDYDNLYNAFRGRAYQQVGQQTADAMLSGAPPPVGDDTLAVIKHFEGYKDTPYWDENHHRVGYGSDTVTRADGKIEEVKPGMKITREDAERDLARRAARSAQVARNAIGEDAWNKLDAKAQASLTSIAYNYGDNGFPKELIGPARSGDKKQLADAVRGLSRHNNGVNTRRRYSEAANIDGDTTQAPSTLPDMIAEVKAKHLPPEAESAAINRITDSYRQRGETLARDRSAFVDKVKDSTAEAMQTGQTTNPIPQQEFVKHFGAEKGAALYEDYSADLVFGAQYKAMDVASNADIQKQLIDAEANLRPRDPGIASRAKNLERLRKAADGIIAQRRDDPAGAALRMDFVKEAVAQYDPQKPETYQKVVSAMMEAQDRLGIEPEYQSPITKKMALELTHPLKTMLPGQERDTLARIADRFQVMFGDEADRAFSYAIRAQKLDNETNLKAANIAKKMALGVPVGRGEGFDADLVRDVAAAEAAVWGGRGGTLSDRQVVDLGPAGRGIKSFQSVVRRGVDNPGETALEPSGGVNRPDPTPKAIRDLFQGTLTDKQFDGLFGTGRAKEIRDRYPLMKQGGQGGG